MFMWGGGGTRVNKMGMNGKQGKQSEGGAFSIVYISKVQYSNLNFCRESRNQDLK